MIVININARKWIEYCSKTIDSSWFIMLFNREFSLSTDSDFSGEDLQTLYSSLNTKKGSVLFKEQSFAGKGLFHGIPVPGTTGTYLRSGRSQRTAS